MEDQLYTVAKKAFYRLWLIALLYPYCIELPRNSGSHTGNLKNRLLDAFYVELPLKTVRLIYWNKYI